MEFFFWLNYINLHQSAFITALAARENTEVTLLAETRMMKKRSTNGWDVPELENVKVIIKPDDALIKSIILNSDKDSLHIFHGMHYPQSIPKALSFAILNKRRTAIWSEPYHWKGAKGYLRFLRTIYHRLKYDKGISFLLPTGNKGTELLLKAGHPRKKIFEWGYFTQKIYSETYPSTPTFNIGYVGHLIKRKGVDYLLNAVAELGNQDVSINIVGEGPFKNELEEIVKNKLLRNVHFHKFMKYGEACRFMGMQDLFVLPSRLDGWGAVVNEALMQGTPVICSDDCGASVLLNEQNGGGVFKGGSVSSLAQLIDKRVQLGKLGTEERNRIKEWAACISTESAVDYFFEIIAHTFDNCARPTPPWRTTSAVHV